MVRELLCICFPFCKLNVLNRLGDHLLEQTANTAGGSPECSRSDVVSEEMLWVKHRLFGLVQASGGEATSCARALTGLSNGPFGP